MILIDNLVIAKGFIVFKVFNPFKDFIFRNGRIYIFIQFGCELFTAILNNRLNTYSESFLLLNENQCGFRKGYSTLDCIYSIHAFFEIIKKKKRKGVIFVTFIFIKRFYIF
jgi:hypothetical protein